MISTVNFDPSPVPAKGPADGFPDLSETGFASLLAGMAPAPWAGPAPAPRLPAEARSAAPGPRRPEAPRPVRERVEAAPAPTDRSMTRSEVREASKAPVQQSPSESRPPEASTPAPEADAANPAPMAEALGDASARTTPASGAEGRPAGTAARLTAETPLSGAADPVGLAPPVPAAPDPTAALQALAARPDRVVDSIPPPQAGSAPAHPPGRIEQSGLLGATPALGRVSVDLSATPQAASLLTESTTLLEGSTPPTLGSFTPVFEAGQTPGPAEASRPALRPPGDAHVHLIVSSPIEPSAEAPEAVRTQEAASASPTMRQMGPEAPARDPLPLPEALVRPLPARPPAELALLKELASVPKPAIQVPIPLQERSPLHARPETSGREAPEPRGSEARAVEPVGPGAVTEVAAPAKLGSEGVLLAPESAPAPAPKPAATQPMLSTGPLARVDGLELAKAGSPEAASRAPTPQAQLEGTVKWMLKAAAPRAELQLHPDSLGKVMVSLRVEGNEVHAKLWASEPSTLPLLQDHRALLEASLRDQGLSLGSFDLQGGQQGHQAPREARDTLPVAPAAPVLRESEGGQEAPTPGVAAREDAHQIEMIA